MPYRFDVARFLTLLLVIVVMFVLFGFGLYGPYYGFGFNTQTLMFLAALVLLAFAASFGRVEPQEDRFDVVTETRCPACGFVATRPFASGDFVSKQDKPCPKDGTATIIDKIYLAEEQTRQPF